jgi:ribosomal protein RSM22 (predicted rRNA methylase)|uniref:Methyltransferase domain-containing protein n=1 Tax=candidate division WOR-3 bacterium TaxID=2052148 RepID=A0A7V3RIJ1_UNCW3
MNLPEKIEFKILSEFGLEGLYENPNKYQDKLDLLRRAMVELSQGFMKRKFVESIYSDAYFCYNFPQNFQKTMITIKKLFSLYNITKFDDEINILDIGCGEGAGMFGIYYYLFQEGRRYKFSLMGIDNTDIFLKRCKNLGEWFNSLNGGIHLELIKGDAFKIIHRINKEYDFIILSNSLNELYPSFKIQMNFIHKLIELLKNYGFIIIIEPALKVLARRLMELRNNLNTLLPCLHSKPCPLLKNRSEWCHQSIRWTPPEYMKILNQKLYRRIEYLKFSYIVIGKERCQNRENSERYSVISKVFRDKGKKRCFVCTDEGVVELIRLDREISEENKDFDAISMGDIIELKNPTKVKPFSWRIGEGTVVKRLDF